MQMLEAFRALNALNEDVFSMDADGVEKLSTFMSDDLEDDTIDIIDPEAETEADLQDNYIGKVILDCCVCHSKLYKNKEEVVLSDTEDLANVGEECPYCFTPDGFKVVGEVAAFNAESEEEEEDPAVEDPEVEASEEEEPEDSAKVEESLQEGIFDKFKKKNVNRNRDENGNPVLRSYGSLPMKGYNGFNDEGDEYSMGGNTVHKLGAESPRSSRSRRDRKYDSLPMKGYALGEATATATRPSIATVLSKHMDEFEEFTYSGDVNKLKDKVLSVVADSDADPKEVADLKRKLMGARNARTVLGTIGAYMSGISGDVDKKKKTTNEEYELYESLLVEGKVTDFVKKVATRVGADASTIIRCFAELGDMATGYKDTGVAARIHDMACHVENKAVLKALLSGNEKVMNSLTKDDIEELEQDIAEYEKAKAARKSGKSDEDDSVNELFDVKLDARGFGGSGNNVSVLGGKLPAMESVEDEDTLKESIDDLSMTANDTHIEVSEDESGKVTVSMEPATNAAGGETIAPVSTELEAEISSNNPDEEEEIAAAAGEEVEADFDEFGEEEMDDLGESYFKKVYENVQSFKTTAVKSTGNSMIIEGLLKFTSGNQKSTSFVFEALDATKTGKFRFIGDNKELTEGKKAFMLTGTIKNNKLIVESMNYNYKHVDAEGKASRVYGTERIK